MAIHQTLLRLVALGIGNTNEFRFPSDIEWKELCNAAFLQGVGAIALDGLQLCYDNHSDPAIDVNTKLQWIGFVKQQEDEYNRQRGTMASLALFFNKHQIKMMVLKGYGLSRYYPKPNHRPCCDLDIYLFGEQERADRLIHEELGIKIDNGHHHHTVFVYKGLTVENHYDFLNIYSHRSTQKIEKWLKECCCVGVGTVEDSGAEIYLPSDDFNALFVLRHMAVEFAATGMNLRQVVDWGLFVKNHEGDVDWATFLLRVKEMNMHHFLDAVNYICYTYLGFSKGIFWGYGDTSYGERVLADVFASDNNPKEKGIFGYQLGRLRNFWRNRWKHRIVYTDSLFSTFIYQVVAHLKKPATLHR